MTDNPYLVGLRLAGKKVLVVGGGSVAQRRIPLLIATGADVHVISRSATPAVEAMSGITLTLRPFEEGDLDGAWYVLALTDSADANAVVAADAEARHTFCVRADRASGGSAWTPATGDATGVTMAAIADHDPLRARRIRDRLVEVVRDESL